MLQQLLLLSHPQPLLLPKIPLLPQPPQKKRRIIIQIQELLPPPKLKSPLPHPQLLHPQLLSHPHDVADKSLIDLPPNFVYIK